MCVENYTETETKFAANASIRVHPSIHYKGTRKCATKTRTRPKTNSNPENTYSVIPSTEEKYISLTMSVYIKSYTDKNGKLKKVYENLRFIDSYKFMLSPPFKTCRILAGRKIFPTGKLL